MILGLPRNRLGTGPLGRNPNLLVFEVNVRPRQMQDFVPPKTASREAAFRSRSLQRTQWVEAGQSAACSTHLYPEKLQACCDGPVWAGCCEILLDTTNVTKAQPYVVTVVYTDQEPIQHMLHL